MISNGRRDFSDTFKYWAEFLPEGCPDDYPTTVLGSNKFSLDNFNIERVIRL
jgi:hypothetical protein